MELLITFLAGAAVLLGAPVIKLTREGERIGHFSLAVALGALLALLIFDLGPEAVRCGRDEGWVLTAVLVLVGAGILALLDRFIPEHEDTDENHDTGNAAHIGIIASLAIVVHNIVEGMTIYSLLENDFRSGLLFALGTALHNIPMGMMIYSTMRRREKKEKIIVFSAVAVSTFAGGLIMFLVRDHISEFLTGALVTVAAGMILYIVAVELIPHVIRSRRPLMNFIGFIVGFAVVLLSSLIG